MRQLGFELPSATEQIKHSNERLIADWNLWTRYSSHLDRGTLPQLNRTIRPRRVAELTELVSCAVGRASDISRSVPEAKDTAFARSLVACADRHRFKNGAILI